MAHEAIECALLATFNTVPNMPKINGPHPQAFEATFFPQFGTDNHGSERNRIALLSYLPNSLCPDDGNQGSTTRNANSLSESSQLEYYGRKPNWAEKILKWKAKKAKFSTSIARTSLHSQHTTTLKNTYHNFHRSTQALVVGDQMPGRLPKTGRELLDYIPNAADVFPQQRNYLHCGAKKFAHETANFCCSNGNIVLATNKLPDALKELLNSSSKEVELFKNCIRTINNQIAFTSLGVKCDSNLARRNKGIYTLRIQGQIYHLINDLIPNGKPAKKNYNYIFMILKMRCQIN
ncbi:hypothetical protein ACH5RR_023361 [Cinchona calisaya]|uniref:Uncharacterized protein n=1 Tax=Cinchona calisaya TaxID=153742 RepID=A0ABD2ZBZ8_9GENT